MRHARGKRLLYIVLGYGLNMLASKIGKVLLGKANSMSSYTVSLNSKQKLT